MRKYNPHPDAQLSKVSYWDRTLAEKIRFVNYKKLTQRASSKVGYAIRNGKLPRVATQTCIICGNRANEYHHHKGYAKKNWLDVVPVCHSCHGEIHRP